MLYQPMGRVGSVTLQSVPLLWAPTLKSWSSTMHYLKETTIDGVKFVLIPEELHDKLAEEIFHRPGDLSELAQEWLEYDPEIFDGL
jgi:hypothetical protein